MKVLRRLHIPDCHFPYVDKRAYNLMLEIAFDFKPHEVVVYGDFFDFYNLSRFDKSPAQTVRLIEEEIVSGIDALHFLCDKFKNIIFLQGNHEDRLRRFSHTYAPLLSSHINLEEVCHIPKQVKVIPYGQNNIYDMGGIIATHGNIYSKHVAHNMTHKYGKSVIFGHTHRIQSFTNRNMGGEISAYNIGWLGDFSKADYKDVNEWSHGFGLSYHLLNSYSFETVHIRDYRTFFEGELYGCR